ncbi:MAG TPA: histidinol-phosphatase HisJ family protein [Bacillota bacterium]
MGDIKIGDGSEEGLYLLDYHVHTKRCGHASGEDREYVEAAIEKGLKELGFADHIPRFYYPENAKVTERGMSPADLEEYVGAVQDLKAAYPEIRIKLGLEVDFVPGWEEQALKLLEPYPWDYLLGSVHFISEWNYGYIGYEKEHTPREIFTAYFDKVAAMAVSGCFDILAHIDLPRRFFPRLPEAEMEELYQVLAARLGKAGAVIELNTFGIRSARQEAVGVFPEAYLLRLCRQYGVQVTLGSDAHVPKDVAADFESAVNELELVGYDRLVTYQSRRPALVEIAPCRARQ